MHSSELSKKRIGFIIFGLMLSVLLAALDTTIVGTAMPKSPPLLQHSDDPSQNRAGKFNS